MSSASAKIRRFQIIIQSLEKGALSKKELLDKLHAQGFEVSDRTFDRDIDELRRDFNVELEYIPRIRAYVLEQDTRDADRLRQVFELSQEVQAMQASFFADASRRDRIQFEPFAGKGTGNLDVLMEAINDEQTVQFIHFNYKTEAHTPYEVYPLLLKEYGRRWYLYAYVEDKKDCRTFGLDRIEQLKSLKTGFQRSLYTSNFSQFTEVIGVNYSENAAREKVVLKCTPLQSWYLDSGPWHASMKKIKTEEDAVWYELDVIPNYELKQKIFSMADQMEVMEPEWFRKEIGGMLSNMRRKY